MTDRTREIRQSSRMTETEALMWAAESDPWLSSGMGSVFVLDDEPDFDAFLSKMDLASHSLLRLRERVDEGLGFAPPRWAIAEDFDITEHVRHVHLPGQGGLRELLDLAAQIFQDPFDVHRPLWQFVVVSGGNGGGDDESGQGIAGGIIMKLHHSLSDGIGAVRLAEMYLDFERHPPTPPPAESPPEPESDDDSGVLETAVSEAAYLARQQLDIARKALAEVSLWGADPGRVRRVADSAATMVKSTANQVGATPSARPGAPLFRTRSRHRHLEVFDLVLDDLRAAGKRLGGSVNDVFVTGSVLAAAAYHAEREVTAESFNLSFIMSTRSDNAAGGNSFAPIPFSVPGEIQSTYETFVAVRDEVAAKRDLAVVGTGDIMNLVAGFATLLPTSVLTKAGRARAAKLDWATSNLRGAPIPIFAAGAHITHMYPVGPLAGTAFNLTAMSYSGNLHFGVFIDPVAVDDPASLCNHLVNAYDDLLSAEPEGGAR